MIVSNTVEGIYRNRSYAENKVDYDCNNGQSWISNYKDVNEKNNGFMTSSCSLNSKCESNRCLLTGNFDITLDKIKTQKICCAWDSYISMATTSAEINSKIVIPSVFIKMTDVDKMKNVLPSFFYEVDDTITTTDVSSSTMLYSPISIYARYESWMNYASLGLWLLGVLTVCYASYFSVSENIRKSNNGQHLYNLVNQDISSDKFKQDISSGDLNEEMESLDLNVYHAIGFIAVASIMLVVLFLFDLYLAVYSPPFSQLHITILFNI